MKSRNKIINELYSKLYRLAYKIKKERQIYKYLPLASEYSKTLKDIEIQKAFLQYELV